LSLSALEPSGGVSRFLWGAPGGGGGGVVALGE